MEKGWTILDIIQQACTTVILVMATIMTIDAAIGRVSWKLVTLIALMLTVRTGCEWIQRITE